MIIRKALFILYKVFLIFITIIFLVNLYIIAEKVFLKNDLPKVFGFSQIIVLSGSMQPAIDAGDFLVIRECREYFINDIVTVGREGILVTHRIVAINNGNVLTKGDANNVADEPVSPTKIEGKIILRIPELGEYILLSKTPFGMLLIAVAGCFLFTVLFISDRFNRLEKK